WGDVKLKETADGKEYLEFNERQTKTRTGSDCRDIRAMPPKMFATDGSEKDPIVVSTKQQMKTSQVLSSVVAGTATKTSSYEKANPVISPCTSESQQSMALFSRAVIQGGNFSININTVNQSPKLTLEESSPAEALPRWKRLRPLEDSDDE
ncbi:unnamed protein product, partial [Porites evermanni]